MHSQSVLYVIPFHLLEEQVLDLHRSTYYIFSSVFQQKVFFRYFKF